MLKVLLFYTIDVIIPPVTVIVHPRALRASIAASPVADGAEPPD
jgi:hypothetical protein